MYIPKRQFSRNLCKTCQQSNFCKKAKFCKILGTINFYNTFVTTCHACFRIEKNCECKKLPWTDVMIKKIFSPQNWQKWSFFAQTTAMYVHM
jgi:hypothetical protein